MPVAVNKQINKIKCSPASYLPAGVHIDATLLLGHWVKLHPDVALNVPADGAAAVHHGVGRPVGARPLDDHHGAHDTHGEATAGAADEGETAGYYLSPHTYLCGENIIRVII